MSPPAMAILPTYSSTSNFEAVDSTFSFSSGPFSLLQLCVRNWIRTKREKGPGLLFFPTQKFPFRHLFFSPSPVIDRGRRKGTKNGGKEGSSGEKLIAHKPPSSLFPLYIGERNSIFNSPVRPPPPFSVGR